jgi:lysophospholipase L1-like esterase
MFRLHVLLLALAGTLTLALSLWAEEKKFDPAAGKWDKEFAALEAKDKQSFPPKNGIVFVGSSSIRLWDLKKSFPELPAVNRGFGGSQLSDSVEHFDRLVLRHQPKIVVLYAGDNDIAGKKSPQQVAADFAAFQKKLRAALPECKLIFISIKPSVARAKLLDKQREANELIRKRSSNDILCTFLDVEKPMQGTDGQVRPDLFLKDGLHLNDAGYKIWNELLLPLLKL